MYNEGDKGFSRIIWICQLVLVTLEILSAPYPSIRFTVLIFIGRGERWTMNNGVKEGCMFVIEN